MVVEQCSEIKRIISTLQVTKCFARAIDFLGSALKFVAGTPDHDDYELLLTKQNMLIENGNRQTSINSAIQDKINEMTNSINILQNSSFSNSIGPRKEEVLLQYVINRNNGIINHLNTWPYL